VAYGGVLQIAEIGFSQDTAKPDNLICAYNLHFEGTPHQRKTPDRGDAYHLILMSSELDTVHKRVWTFSRSNTREQKPVGSGIDSGSEGKTRTALLCAPV